MSKRNPTKSKSRKSRRRLNPAIPEHPHWTWEGKGPTENWAPPFIADEVDMAALKVSEAARLSWETYRSPEADEAQRIEASKRILAAEKKLCPPQPGPKPKLSREETWLDREDAEEVAKNAIEHYKIMRIFYKREHLKRRAEMAKKKTVDYLMEELDLEPNKRDALQNLPLGERGYNRMRLRNDLLEILTGRTGKGLKATKRRGY